MILNQSMLILNKYILTLVLTKKQIVIRQLLLQRFHKVRVIYLMGHTIPPVQGTHNSQNVGYNNHNTSTFTHGKDNSVNSHLKR